MFERTFSWRALYGRLDCAQPATRRDPSGFPCRLRREPSSGANTSQSQLVGLEDADVPLPAGPVRAKDRAVNTLRHRRQRELGEAGMRTDA
jgi:hypothetical protein